MRSHRDGRQPTEGISQALLIRWSSGSTTKVCVTEVRCRCLCRRLTPGEKYSRSARNPPIGLHALMLMNLKSLRHRYYHSLCRHLSTDRLACRLKKIIWHAMLRPRLFQAAARLSRQDAGHAGRKSFSSSVVRRAEVSLTIDGKSVSIEGKSCNP